MLRSIPVPTLRNERFALVIFGASLFLVLTIAQGKYTGFSQIIGMQKFARGVPVPQHVTELVCRPLHVETANHCWQTWLSLG